MLGGGEIQTGRGGCKGGIFTVGTMTLKEGDSTHGGGGGREK